jgi:uncharacterized membrane protein YkvA (DUF1232 family)
MTMQMQTTTIDAGGFWRKVGRVAKRAGRAVVVPAVTLYECLADPLTPLWARVQIVGALVYFVCPADLVPDALPVIGYGDDATVLAVTLKAVDAHVRPEHRERARERAGRWFGD